MMIDSTVNVDMGNDSDDEEVPKTASRNAEGSQEKGLAEIRGNVICGSV